MSTTSRVLTSRTIARVISRPHLRDISSPQSRHFAAARPEPYRPNEVNRACGVPETAPEAGPRNVGGIMRPGFWLLGLGAALGITAFLVLAPDSGTMTGDAMQRHIRSEREGVERARGDREEEETPRIRRLELAEMEDAKREKGAARKS